MDSLKLKNTISKVKNSLDELNSILETIEKKISKLEDSSRSYLI